MTSRYNQEQWEKNVRNAFTLITTPIIYENPKTGQTEIHYRTWQQVKKITGLSWATLREVSQMINEAQEKQDENVRLGVGRAAGQPDEDPLPGDTGHELTDPTDIHPGEHGAGTQTAHVG